MKAEAIIENRKKWLAVNRIQDWNDADTLHVCKLIAELAFQAGRAHEYAVANKIYPAMLETKEQFINDLFK